MNQPKLKLTVVLLIALVALGGVIGQTAQAASLRVAQNKPFSKMTRNEKIAYLKKQLHSDRCIIRFWNNPDHKNLRIEHRWIYHKEIHWVKISLRIAGKNLQNLTRHTVSSGMTGRGTVPQLICKVFGSACPMALRVAYRESRYSIYAVNGQYLGIFQMGSAERARFATIGYSTAYEQIVAAHNYYLVSGWGPWSQTAY